ncbi:MAG: hypothetical protein IPK10_04270 [Bacteroidetes bacterium]|nr:hypothetical protein [Bacteroidota bacterium]
MLDAHEGMFVFLSGYFTINGFVMVSEVVDNGKEYRRQPNVLNICCSCDHI